MITHNQQHRPSLELNSRFFAHRSLIRLTHEPSHLHASTHPHPRPHPHPHRPTFHRTPPSGDNQTYAIRGYSLGKVVQSPFWGAQASTTSKSPGPCPPPPPGSQDADQPVRQDPKFPSILVILPEPRLRIITAQYRRIVRRRGLDLSGGGDVPQNLF